MKQIKNKIYLVILVVFIFILILLFLNKNESPYGLEYNSIRNKYGIQLLDSTFRAPRFESNPTRWESQDPSSVYVLKQIGVWDTIVNEGDLFVIRFAEEEYYIKKFFFYETKEGKASLIRREHDKNIFLQDTCYHCFDSILQLRNHQKCMEEIKNYIARNLK